MQSRSGELAMRPLPAVLLDLHEELATGKLQLRRGRVAKTVDLVNGNPVSTASTPRDETLGHFLVNSGMITEEQHRAAVSRASTVGGKLGEALVALQILTVEQLIDQLGKQARHKLVQALRWPQGAWRFDPADQAVEGMQLRMLEIVFGGLRETAVEDPERLARLEGMSFELTERGKRLRHELRRILGDRPFAALSAGAPIAEIEKLYGDRVQARIGIDAMVMCDAIVTRTSEIGLGAGPAAKRTLMGVAPVGDAPVLELPDDDDTLYSTLFDDEITVGPAVQPAADGEAPLDFELELPDHDRNEDSGVVSNFELERAHATRKKAVAARKAIAAEHQRIHGADHYAVLLIERDCDVDDVDAGHQIKLAMLERMTGKSAGEGGGAPVVLDAKDRAKLDEIVAAYAHARAVLVDPAKRAAYDRELAGGELVSAPPALDTELSFRMAEQHMARKQWAHAIGLLETVLARSPGEADYHAALGWATWHAGEAEPAATADALAHLGQALTIDPDHPAAHDYKGRISAHGIDESVALFHLERALDLDPGRAEALATVESLLVARGELRRYERVLKRLLFRMRGKGGAPEIGAWVRLARLYLDHLDDPNAATAAVTSASKLGPHDPEVVQLAARIESYRRDAAELPRAGWREKLSDPGSGAALVQSTAASGHADAAFLAASTMVALGTADDTMGALYDQHRVKGVSLPTAPLSRDHWALLRHKDDALELGGLVELVAPAIHALAPMTLADSDLDAGQLVPDGELPPAFARVRGQLAKLLGVGIAAPVYARTELSSQIHVVACEPPVLAAGDEALTAPERPDLVFRLARAMTFLWPGRAVGASRPGRVLKAVVLAIVREAAGTELGVDDPLAPRATAAIGELSPAVRAQARAAAIRLLSRSGGGLNLSLWARALSRTADRAGLLLCRDVPAAVAGARDMGDLDKDLIEFAFGAAHVSLRRQLGLSTR
jgi:tetratricopeptide (TPR) repeat protein